MDLNVSNEDLSDDEIYFGKVSIKEIKKHIFMGHSSRQTISCLPEKREPSYDESFTLIETNSEPSISGEGEINSPDLKSISGPNFNQIRMKSTDSDVKPSDDSFLRLENMVTELCISPRQDTDQVLDNTLDVVNFILNSVPTKDDSAKYISDDKNVCSSVTAVIEPEMTMENIQIDEKNTVKIQDKDCCEMKHDTYTVCVINDDNTDLNLKENIIECKQPETKRIYSKTPNKTKLNQEHVFKTPKTMLSCKKQSATSTKTTPFKSSAYQHITSPIASYIKKSPQIPLLQAVHPKKPLPGISAIPKLAKSTEHKIDNKENIQLPSIAYKSAKKTKLVSAPDTEKLPQGQRIKKLITSLPKPVVIKHDHRQVNSSVKHIHSTQEDSFANLTLHQADLSVCTQKSAFTK